MAHECIWGQGTAAPCTFGYGHEGECSTELARVENKAHENGYADRQTDCRTIYKTS